MQLKKLFVSCLALALFAATATVSAQYSQRDHRCRSGNCQIISYRSQPPSVTADSVVRASAILRYYRDYTFSSRSEDQILKGLTITADNINTRIMAVSFIVDNQLVLSKVADPYIGADTITLSSSDRKIIAKGDRSLRIVIYASGVSSFRGNISTTGSSSGSNYSIPFSVFLPDR
ncbi:MAG: hypothetical protein WC926_00775 [Candidatus Paceibacterota bacterium]